MLAHSASLLAEYFNVCSLETQWMYCAMPCVCLGGSDVRQVWRSRLRCVAELALANGNQPLDISSRSSGDRGANRQIGVKKGRDEFERSRWNKASLQ